MERVAFHLSVTLEKDVYRRGESIPLRLEFVNSGDVDIELDGILPIRDTARPPYLEVESDDHRLILVEHGISRELMNDSPIVIAPGRSVLLMELELDDTPASIRTREEAGQGEYGRDVIRLAPELIPGEYSLRATFHPTPKQFRSTTAWIPFTIR